MHLRNHPLCVHCLAAGITTAAIDVDHIIPKREGGTDHPANLQSLCHSCHSKKTMSTLTIKV
jgi:5-methylcytosine-specific restriction protein A